MSSLTFILAFAILTILVVVLRFVPGGCSGDCEQGRKPCNCGNKWEK